MKNMMKPITLLLMVFISSAIFFGSCKKDSTTTPADQTALTKLMVSADSLSTAAIPANYPQTAIDAYKTTLQTIKTAAASTSLTQVQVDNLVVQLNAAMTLFKTKAYSYIDESLYLNAGWHFDEGTGTTATAFSTVKHVGTFVKGNAGVFATDAALPTWITGVKGGHAIYLKAGAHLEVPYTTAFLPVNISISVWIKADELYENNYILSQNYWEGYKLQTQHEGKPFFTYKSGTSYINKDNETVPSVVVGQWAHLVITLNSTAKELKFFVNGTLTKTWTSTGEIVAFPQTLLPAPQPFLIGCVATDTELATWSWTESPASLGYFKGAIDELKIYNIALSDGQVSKLYNDEKP